ncbi:hypothetical protein BscR1v2_014160 [Bartonella schoenbuchensis R1]|uniref:Uncharacterized protein n=1 Tax=Bartonella schoenbuchensis (strain DSM 13525 / NCTC 13165 / R1) TaxID=687861 RepID=A0A1S6XSH6_BARSR|nr:hypothetical protein BscR1v2_014160 [Bartonella schoenbuchensis R1]
MRFQISGKRSPKIFSCKTTLLPSSSLASPNPPIHLIPNSSLTSLSHTAFQTCSSPTLTPPPFLNLKPLTPFLPNSCNLPHSRPRQIHPQNTLPHTPHFSLAHTNLALCPCPFIPLNLNASNTNQSSPQKPPNIHPLKPLASSLQHPIHLIPNSSLTSLSHTAS